MSLSPAERYGIESSLPAFIGQGGDVHEQELVIDGREFLVGDVLPEELRAAYSMKIEELYDSRRAIEGWVKGKKYTFDILTSESSGKQSDTLLCGASYSSSPDNPGNVFELARRSVARPDTKFVYVASQGFGWSSPMPHSERRNVSRRGSFLYEEFGHIKPSPVVKALGRALDLAGIQVTGTYSESSSALPTGAFAASIGVGKIGSIHQHARTNVQHMQSTQLAKAMLYDDGRNSRRMIADSSDALRWNDRARPLVATSKSPEYFEREKQRAVGLRIPHVPTLGAMACALARGPQESEWMTSDISNDPLLRDLLAAVRQQPDANVLLTWGDKDPLLPVNYTERLSRIVGELSFHSHGKVAAVIVPGGTHSLHTHYPQLVEAIPKTIFR